MKKKLVLSISIICIMTAVCAGLVACKKPLTNLQKLENQVSTMQTQLFVGVNENFNASIITCKQEETFIADGKVGKLKTETVMTIQPKNTETLNKKVDFMLVGEKASLEGKLTKDKIGIELCANIENIETLGKIVKVTLTYDGKAQDVVLKNRLDGMITPTAALKSAYGKFKTEIDTLMESKKFEKEVYIKVVEDKQVGGDNCYWFVSFIENSDEYWSALIDIKTGEVLNSKVYPAVPTIAGDGKLVV